MRTLKSGLITVIAIGLLAGSAIGVAAQDEEATSVPVTIGPPLDEDSPEIPVEAADPRASGVMITENDFGGSSSHTIVRSGIRLTNDDGAWVGTGLDVAAIDEAATDCPAGQECYPATQGSMYELAGEGGYDGLTMFIIDQPEGAYLGVIVPTTSVPTQPDPPAAQ